MNSRREPLEPGEESVWTARGHPGSRTSSRESASNSAAGIIADTTRAKRVLETSHPPRYYIPREDIVPDALEPADGSSYCEWKDHARYWAVRTGERVSIRDHVAFYCAQMDACLFGDERAEPQPGGFYGGWVMSRIKGPFKGEPGTQGW